MKKNNLFFVFLLTSLLTHSQLLKPGKWRGVIHYTNTNVPFTFEVSYPGGNTPQFTFINGQERRVIDKVKVTDDSVFVSLTPFDVEIRAAFTATSMTGSYIKHYKVKPNGFSAVYGMPRMMKKSVRVSPPLENRWRMVFEPETSNEAKAVGVFRQIGGMVTGTVMTEVSDYRYFEGIMDGDSIKLSSFDGAHAFKIIGRKSGGEWEGVMIYDEAHTEDWKAKPDADASLEDPFDMVVLEEGKHKPYFDLLSAGSGRNAIDPLEYEGKVVVIQLFGTWCPNSHDQTKYLVSWYRENQNKDIAVLAASYEANYSKEYGLRRLEEYKEANNIPYQLVLGGKLSKTDAAMPFPFLRKIHAFPTLVILDKEGYARYVHSYFNGPATGSFYKTFDRRFNEIIDQLLEE